MIEKVCIYRNLHKNCWSVKNRRTGRVIAHRNHIVLSNGAIFKVSIKGRERVLREKVKNVHAGVWGEWNRNDAMPTLFSPKRIRYNPYENPWFMDEDGKAIVSASRVEFRSDGTAWAEGILYFSNNPE
jgi:hypothetical protein